MLGVCSQVLSPTVKSNGLNIEMKQNVENGISVVRSLLCLVSVHFYLENEHKQ